MRFTPHFGALLFGVLVSASNAAQGSVVETYSKPSASIHVAMPMSTGGGNYTSPFSIKVNSIDFSPGAVVFNGQPVDFDGTEPQWIGSSYSGTVAIPIPPTTPATVPVTGPFSITGPAVGGSVTGTFTIPSLRVGPGFSANNFDIVTPQNVQMRWEFPSFQSPPNPVLNGIQVGFVTDCTLTSVDAVNGIVTFNGSGTINATVGIPTVSPLGLLALGLCLAGAAVMILRSRVRIA